MTLVEKARVFAGAAHAAVGQVRKYTGDPYIVHPIEVMNFLSQFNPTEEMKAAALLHDVVEDTDVTLDLIEQEFGSKVANLVGWLTDVSKPEDGNRATRKAIDRDHSAQAPGDAQTVKLCDLWSNTRSIVYEDPGFAVTYLREKRLLMEVLTRADPRVWQVVMESLEAGEKHLEQTTEEDAEHE